MGRGPSERLAADLAVLGRTPERHTLDKLYARPAVRGLGAGARDPLPIVDAGVPRCLPMVVGALLFAPSAGSSPTSRSAAPGRRRPAGVGQALTVYVDIVGISLAGGAGSRTR